MKFILKALVLFTAIGGDNCKEFHWITCKKNICQNGGTCRYDDRIPRKDVCFCKFGFTGSQCQFKNPCYRNEDADEAGYRDPLLNVCFNGATCNVEGTDKDGYKAKCACAEGYKGDLCESLDIKECIEGICNGGSCQLYKNRTRIRCNCFPGKHGDRCQYDDKCYHLKPCNNNGTCTMIGNDYKCSCLPGWSGRDCKQDVNECELGEQCSNNGKCVNTKGSFYCECANGWTKDKQCRIWTSPCSDNPCENGGMCRFEESTYEEHCDCPIGFTGKKCQIRAPGCNNNCRNDGRCLFNQENERFSCLCPSNYTGNHCEKLKNPCDDAAVDKCENGGICSPELSRAAGGKIKCICQPPYYGDICNIPMDFCVLGKSRCKNGGHCMSTPTSFKCICLPGYRGELCEQRDPCASFPCQNNGTCVVFDESEYKCRCPFAFHGKNCENGVCPCQNNGICTQNNGCQCLRDFTGQFCQTRLDSFGTIIALNLTIDGNKRYRDDLIEMFKKLLFKKFTTWRKQMNDVNVTKCDENSDYDDCVRFLFRIPSDEAVKDTLDGIKSLHDLPEGLRVTDVKALVQNDNSFIRQLTEPSSSSSSSVSRMLIGVGVGVIGAITIIALVAVLRTQAILKTLRFPIDQHYVSDNGHDSIADRKRKRISYDEDACATKKGKGFDGAGFVSKSFSKLKDTILRLWTPLQIEDDENRVLLESDRALVYSILTCAQSTDNDKAYRLAQVLEIIRSVNLRTNDSILIRILACLNDKTEESALHISVRKSLVECSRVLVTKFPSLVRCRDGSQRTPLHIAAATNSIVMFKLMCEMSRKYLNLNVVDGDGRTPLQVAILTESIAMAESLIEKGAKVNIVTASTKGDNSSMSALHIAARVDSSVSISLLLARGAHIDILNDSRETPLMCAIENNALNAAKLLITYGAQIDVVSKTNWTPLSMASNSTSEMLNLIRQALFEQQLTSNKHVKKSKKRVVAQPQINTNRRCDEAKRRCMNIQNSMEFRQNCCINPTFATTANVTSNTNQYLQDIDNIRPLQNNQLFYNEPLVMDGFTNFGGHFEQPSHCYYYQHQPQQQQNCNIEPCFAFAAHPIQGQSQLYP